MHDRARRMVQAGVSPSKAKVERRLQKDEADTFGGWASRYLAFKADPSELMLALCVREENLLDPARWCGEMRQYMREVGEGPVTAEQSERLMIWSDRLSFEAAGSPDVTGSQDPLMPEVAAFNAYEAAIRHLKD